MTRHDNTTEFIHLLRHGCSSVSILDYGRVVSLQCSPLWVEMHVEKRIRLNNLMRGPAALADRLAEFPDGTYTWQQISEKLQ